MNDLQEVIQRIYRDGVIDTCENVECGEELKRCDDRSIRQDWLDKAEAEILDSLDPWTSVEEGTPKENGDYWVTFMVGDKRLYSQDHFNGNHWLCDDIYFTHWAPIIPPKG